MKFFIKGLRSQTRMLLDSSARGTIRVLTEAQVKDLMEKMCLNEYQSKSERKIKVESTSTR